MWFEAEFYGRATDHGHRRQGGQIDGAQGVVLYCPCRYGHDEGAHGLLIPFSNPRNADPLPDDHGSVSRDGNRPRWQMSGTGLHDLTLSPSVDVGTDSCWHGWITNGEVK